MNKRAITSNYDCKDSEFSIQEKTEQILDIRGVAYVFGDKFGGPVDFSEKPVVVLYERFNGKRIRGTPEEYEIKSQIEEIFGNVEYEWLAPSSYGKKLTVKGLQKELPDYFQ